MKEYSTVSAVKAADVNLRHEQVTVRALFGRVVFVHSYDNVIERASLRKEDSL